MNAHRPMTLAVLTLASTISLAASRALGTIYPDAAPPSGYGWVLGPNLIINSTFESDTVGNTPTGWTGEFGTFLTAADGASGSKSGELVAQAWTSLALVSGVTAGRFFQLTVTYKDRDSDNTPLNFFTSPVRDFGNTSLVGEAFRLVDTEGGTIFTERSRNDRQPGVVSYNHATNIWVTFSYTFETRAGMTNHNNELYALFYADDQGESIYRIDSVMFQEFDLVPVPEASTMVLLGLGMALIGRRRSSQRGRPQPKTE